MNSKIVAVCLVAILAISAVAALVLMQGDGDDKSRLEGSNRLPVYGNANNDDYLDDMDLDFIRGIIDSGSWDRDANPYADANSDGNVDSSDVDYLEGMLKKEDTLMYYTDAYGNTSHISYPVRGGIGAMYEEEADLAILLGIWDRVTAVGSDSMNDAKNPGWESKNKFGAGSNKVEFETVLDSGVSVLIAFTGRNSSTISLMSAVEQSGAPVDILALNLDDKISRVITAGVMFDATDRAYDYVRTCDEALENMKDTLSSIDADDAPSVLTCMITGSETISVFGPTSVNGMYTYLAETPSDLVMPENSTSHQNPVDPEWVLEVNPDYIVFVGRGIWSPDMTESEAQTVFESTCERYFGHTDAYKNGRIIGTDNNSMGSYPAGFAFLSVVSGIYDEIYDQYAADLYRSYFDRGFAYYSLEDIPVMCVRTLPAS